MAKKNNFKKHYQAKNNKFDFLNYDSFFQYRNSKERPQIPYI